MNQRGKPVKWEYKIRTHKDPIMDQKDEERLLEELHNMDSEGWELVTAMPFAGIIKLILKRPAS
jgi:hypothetical protein